MSSQKTGFKLSGIQSPFDPQALGNEIQSLFYNCVCHGTILYALPLLVFLSCSSSEELVNVCIPYILCCFSKSFQLYYPQIKLSQRNAL